MGESDAERVQCGLAPKRARDEEDRFDEMLRRYVVRWMMLIADQVLDRIRLGKRVGEALSKRSPKGCLRLRSRSPGGWYGFSVPGLFAALRDETQGRRVVRAVQTVRGHEKGDRREGCIGLLWEQLLERFMSTMVFIIGCEDDPRLDSQIDQTI